MADKVKTIKKKKTADACMALDILRDLTDNSLLVRKVDIYISPNK